MSYKECIDNNVCLLTKNQFINCQTFLYQDEEDAYCTDPGITKHLAGPLHPATHSQVRTVQCFSQYLVKYCPHCPTQD